MRRWVYYIVALLSALLLWSCSTRRNTKASRFFHAFTTRYNIYFNGKEAFDEALRSQQEGYQENYSEMIYMYPISAQPKDKATTGGAFDRAIEKSNKAIKLHSIKSKPAKKPGWRNDPKQRAFQEQEEYNPFLKNSWLMLGEAQFYNADFLQASATFSYITRHYAKEQEVVSTARLWQARCYAEMGWLYEAENILQQMNKRGIPASCQNHFATVYADCLIKNQEFEKAIPYLQTAIQAEKNHRQRMRMKYLLGQIYANLGRDESAYETFGQVAHANPPYELEFAARIRQTEVFEDGNFQQVTKMLKRMAKDPKNKNLLDQVFYALGNISLNRKDTLEAIKHYQMGIEKSTKNGLDKAICQIKLGDIYFSQRSYIKAQPYFSGALAGIRKEHKDYERVSKLSAILDKLVVHAVAIHVQDSLQALVRLPEAERLAIIDQKIELIKKEEEKEKGIAEKEAYLAEQADKGSGIIRSDMETPAIITPVSSEENSFYFYNPQTIAQGKILFQRKWGQRPLEDHWRRRKKELSTLQENPEEELEEMEIEQQEKEEIPSTDDPHSRAYYLQQLPFTQEEMDNSNRIIADGLYHMGMIYKDELEDIPLSVEAFESLLYRFPENKYREESYYQIYLMALRSQNDLLATEYKTKLIREFPESDYAMTIADPNYAYNISRMDAIQDSIYQLTYERYLAGDTSYVHNSYYFVREKYPLASLMPKFIFLDALSYVQSGNVDRFKAALRNLIEKYPQADVSELAGEMLKGLLRGRALVQGEVRGMRWDLRFGIQEDGSLAAEDSARLFSTERNTPHQMLLVYPTGSIDQNQLLFAVATYNFSNFMVKELDLSFEQFEPISLLAIKGFINLDEIIHYYKLIHGKEGFAKTCDRMVTILPISNENYETLMRGKSLEEYITFFDETFGSELPELVARWKARIEVAQTDSITPDAQPIDSLRTDTIRTDSPKNDMIPATFSEGEDLGMSLQEIQKIRKQREAEEKRRKEEARQTFEKQQKVERTLREQKAKERVIQRKKEAEEERRLLKVKNEQEKQLKKLRKVHIKQAEMARKSKKRAKEKERKEKERAYKQQLKAKEKARKSFLRAKEKAAREKKKARRR